MLAGRYELDQEIGRGAAGVVWRGRDTLLERDVAIKQLGVTADGAPDLARSGREANLTASLRHDHVVSVFDLVEQDGWQWLVMELVDGPTLRGRIEESGALDPGEMAPLLRQLAGALAAAHALGIVHRDVKPSNVLLTRDGIAKLSDFGMARGREDASLTQTGLVTGSPAYLAPEVATGRPATAASDVWSLGTTAFHALAGQRPYGDGDDGDDVFGAMYRMVHEEPPRLPGGGKLAWLVASMMQREPTARPTMAEIEAILTTAQPRAEQSPAELPRTAQPLAEQPLAAQPSAVVVERPPSRRWMWAGVASMTAVIVAAAAGAAVAIASGDRQPAQEADRGSGTALRVTDALTAGALEGFVADYLTMASNDPKAAFALLTDDFQRASGGYRDYRGFWRDVSGLDLKKVRGDPATLTVKYTYSYDREGKRRTDDVVLRLERSGKNFLIAGEA